MPALHDTCMTQHRLQHSGRLPRYLAEQRGPASGATETMQQIDTVVELTSGDFAQAYATQNRGTTKNLLGTGGTEGRHFFVMKWVGPAVP
jgi:hypothetical protein